MKDQDLRLKDRALRVQTYGIENVADFAAGSKAKGHFANVDSLLVLLVGAAAGQKPKRISKTTLLDALGIDLLNISRTARQLELKENGFAAPYLLPANTSEPALIIHTEGLLRRLEDQSDDTAAVKTAKAALRGRFIEYELPVDFVAHLRADLKAIADATRFNQGEGLGGVEDTELIGQLLGKLNTEIAELNAIMHNKYTRQPEKLRAWRSACHVERAPHREKKTPTLPGPTPPK